MAAPLSPLSPTSPASPPPFSADAGDAHDNTVMSPHEDVDLIVEFPHEEPGTTRVLKLKRMDTARHIIDECKRIVTKTPALDNYCVYWLRDDEEDRSGLFLDPERPLGFYSDLSSGTHIEFRLCRRPQPVYISEQKVNQYMLDETWPVARVIHEIAGKLGLRDASRYGLLLLGREEEVRQRREELEGQWANRRQSTMLSHSNSGHSLAGTLQRNLPHSTSSGSVSLATLANSGSLSNSATNLMGSQDSLSTLSSRASMRSRRPVSILFMQENGTVSRANVKSGDRRRSVMDLSATKSTGSADKEFNFVETKDRGDWLKADMPLRCQMVDPSDSLLLVRQEKILSFIDRMREDPKSLANQLLEDADESLRGLKALQQELRAFLADVSVSDVRTLQRTTSADATLERASSTAGGTKGRAANAGGPSRGTSLSDLPPLAATNSSGSQSGGLGGDASKAATMQRNASLRRTVSSSKASAPVVVERTDPIRKEGFLFKKAKLFDQWKKRYFVLRNGNLSYYESMTSEKLIGQFPIFGTNVQVMDHYKRHDHVFSITVQGRVRYLCAQSPELMREWAEAISEEAMRPPT